MRTRHLLLFVVVIVYFSGNFLIDRWPTSLYYGDSNSYYLHLVSFFIYNDVGNYSKSIASLQEANPASPDPREDPFGIRLTEKGKRYIKYTLGVPVLEGPFFLLAHLFCQISDAYPANGWSKPYLFAVSFSVVFYILLGFYFLIKVLESYFSKGVVVLVVLSLALATNLFYQATFVTMAHGYLFFAHSLLIYLTIEFHRKPNRRKAFLLGLVVGLITLCRVPELICVLIPLLWGVVDRKSLRKRIHFIRNNASYMLLALLGFFTLFSLQLIYWKYVSDHWIFNPYQGEGFNFLKPRIHKGWFHFANGWLIYTPIMAFSLLGLLFLKKYLRDALLPILAFVGLHAYIHYSYYAWTYFPGLGSRPMIETYPLLSFGMAACFSIFYQKKALVWIPLSSLLFFSGLNLFQTWQMKKGILWSERTNWPFYYETFGRLKSSQKALRTFDANTMQPDSSELKLAGIVYTEGFESFNHQPVDSTIKHQGKFSLFISEDFLLLKDQIALPEVQPGDWLRIRVMAYMRKKDEIFNRDATAMLNFELFNNKNSKRKSAHIRMTPHIGNETHSIWTGGKVDQWGESAFFIKVPGGFKPDWRARLSVKNPAMQKLYIDELQVEWYR